MPSKKAGAAPRRAAMAAIAYAAAVLAVDTLAAQMVRWPFDWHGLFAWRMDSGFDLFKCVFWGAIPLAFCLRCMDWGWLGVARWRKTDLWLLAALAAAGSAAMLVIPLFPALRDIYPGLSGAPASARQEFAITYAIWTLSWLPAWEFLHRYFLLTRVDRAWPRLGWLIVPLSETLYHLQKPWPEAAGMLALSLVLTWWARKRRNLLLPLVVHAIIEAQLVLFILMT